MNQYLQATNGRDFYKRWTGRKFIAKDGQVFPKGQALTVARQTNVYIGRIELVAATVLSQRTFNLSSLLEQASA